MTTEKPFSPSCERNQAVILEIIKEHLRPTDKNLLEIGSGTGQHAVYMGQHLPGLIWQTSDVAENHAGIQLWLDEYELSNVLPPLFYRIGKDQWPASADLIFSANTLHIMSSHLVETLIIDLGRQLAVNNRVFFYGPFRYGGEYTSNSNAEFDLWLKDKDPQSGVRDFEEIDQWMNQQAMTLLHDIVMPANNQMLIYEKQ